MSFIGLKNNFKEVPLKKRKILFITAEDRDEPYIQHHDTSFKRYTNKWGYSYSRLDNCPKEESSTYWCKIYKVKKALETGNYDYVLWADSDTSVVNDKNLDSLISLFGEPDIIIGENFIGWTKKILYTLQNIGLDVCNAGVFLIKNSEIGRSFINDCLAELDKRPWCIKDGKEQGIWAGMCYEEGVMNKLIKTKYRNNTYLDKNAELVLTVQEGVTDDYNSIYTKPLFVHLNGNSNEVRNEVFKRLI